jgi:hypothetical protein
MAPIRTGSHPACGRVVPALLGFPTVGGVARPSDYCNQLPSIPSLQHYEITYGLTPRAETVAALNAAGAHRANVLA